VSYSLPGDDEAVEERKQRLHRLSQACSRAGKQAAAAVALATAVPEAERLLQVRCSKCNHAYEAAADGETVQQQKQRWEPLGKACARREKKAIAAATPAASAATADADRATEQDLEEQCRELEVAYAGPPLDETVQLRTARWRRLRAVITRRRNTTAEEQRARTELVHIDPPHLSNPEDVTNAVRDAIHPCHGVSGAAICFARGTELRGVSACEVCLDGPRAVRGYVRRARKG
jgi:hypothetical protein